MKKKLKIILPVCLVLLLTWSMLLCIDCHAVTELRDPVIAQHTGVEGGRYIGPGWTVEVDKIHETTADGEDMGWRTVSAELYLFGILIAAAIS